MDLASESRIVMTLDAGGANLRFSAMRGGKPVTIGDYAFSLQKLGPQ